MIAKDNGMITCKRGKLTISIVANKEKVLAKLKFLREKTDSVCINPQDGEREFVPSMNTKKQIAIYEEILQNL
jgi:hypothetical protein